MLIGEGYIIRSLYFDSLYDRDFYDKEDGVEKRVLLDKDLTAQADILFTDNSDLYISCNIEYAQGDIHEDNYGNASYFNPEGTLSVEKTYIL